MKLNEIRTTNSSDVVSMAINELVDTTHIANKKWWFNLEDNTPKERNVAEMLMLIVSELAEAMEGDRKNLMDDKLPHRKMIEVELADALIRMFDLAGGLKMDLGGAYVEKMAFNESRADHKRENRLTQK